MSTQPRIPVSDPAAMAGWILGSMSSGIVAVDERGLVAMLNSGAQRILGCPAGALSDSYGRPCREVLSAQPAVARLLLDTLDGRDALSRAELVLEDRDGDPVSTIGFTLTPVRDADGSVRGAAMIFRDLTPFERMDEQERLRERLAALGQMAAGLAHEIRNPLASMEVVAGLLKRRLVDCDDELSLIEQLTRELRTVARTVSDCLEFVRPLSPERGPVDVVALVEESLATVLTRAPFDGEVKRVYAEEVPELCADVEQLRAVVNNLILNAIEAMAAGDGDAPKRLVVGVDAREVCERSVRVGIDGRAADDGSRREVVVSVADNGPGVPAELREKIFYPFFTTKQSGSGVGLATSQKIAASHGGSLELDTGAQRGTVFRLRLPLEGDKA